VLKSECDMFFDNAIVLAIDFSPCLVQAGMHEFSGMLIDNQVKHFMFSRSVAWRIVFLVRLTV